MPRLPLIILLTYLLPACGLAMDVPRLQIPEAPAGSGEVPAHRFLYRDHRDGRVVAVVEARLQTDQAEVVRLELRISARAAEIQPAVGWEQVGGSNRTTALDIERLKASGLLTLGIADANGSWHADAATYLRAIGRMPLPERRQEDDGSISAAVPSRRPYLTELIVTSGPLRAGEEDVAVLVAQAPRLIVRYRHVPGTTRILDIDDPLRPHRLQEPAP